MQITPPFYAYSAHRDMQRALFDMKAPEGREAFLRLAERADVVIESFRPGVVDRLGIGWDADVGAQPAPRLLLDQRLRADRARARSGRATTSTTSGSAASSHCSGRGADGQPPVPGATVADSAGGGMHAVMAILAALVRRATTGAGAYLDVSIADGMLGLMALAVDEYLATGEEPGPRHGLLTGRYACYDTYPTRDGKWLTVAAIEPHFWANLCEQLGLAQWTAHQHDDAVQDQIRADLARGVRHARPRRLGRELSAADTCVAPVLTVPEVVDDEQFVARGDVRRTRSTSSRASSARSGRCSRGWRSRRHRTRHATRPSPTPTRCCAPPGCPTTSSPSCTTRVVRARDDLPARRAGADREAAVRGGRRVPGRARLLLDQRARRSRTATRSSGTTRSPTRSPTVRWRRRSLLSAWFRPHHWAPGRAVEKLPLQIHFDMKARFELPEAIMTENTTIFHEPVRPGDMITQRAAARVGERGAEPPARHRSLLGDRRRVPQPARRAVRRRTMGRLRLPARTHDHARRREGGRRAPAAVVRRDLDDGRARRARRARLAADAPRPPLRGRAPGRAGHLPELAEPGLRGSSASSPTGRDRRVGSDGCASRCASRSSPATRWCSRASCATPPSTTSGAAGSSSTSPSASATSTCTESEAKVAVPTAPDDNPWQRHGDDWRP